MFGPLGFPEIIFILALALLVFGPKKLPEIGRTIGRAMGELRRATSDLKTSFDTDLSLDDKRSDTASPAPATPAPATPEVATAPTSPDPPRNSDA